MPTATHQWRLLREGTVSLVIGSLAGTVLLESIDPRSALGDFIFWPQRHFRYFLKYGANNPIAPRVMFLVIVAALSLFALFAVRTSVVGSRISRGVTPAILAVLLPMISWVVTKHWHLGIEAPFAAALTLGYIGSVLYFAPGRRRTPLWFWLSLWLFWLCWWGYLFHSALDPVNLIDPVVGFICGVVWSFSVSPVTPQTA